MVQEAALGLTRHLWLLETLGLRGVFVMMMLRVAAGSNSACSMLSFHPGGFIEFLQQPWVEEQLFLLHRWETEARTCLIPLPSP